MDFDRHGVALIRAPGVHCRIRHATGPSAEAKPQRCPKGGTEQRSADDDETVASDTLTTLELHSVQPRGPSSTCKSSMSIPLACFPRPPPALIRQGMAVWTCLSLPFPSVATTVRSMLQQ